MSHFMVGLVGSIKFFLNKNLSITMATIMPVTKGACAWGILCACSFFILDFGNNVSAKNRGEIMDHS